MEYLRIKGITAYNQVVLIRGNLIGVKEFPLKKPDPFNREILV